jgi:hypothetical protein
MFWRHVSFFCSFRTRTLLVKFVWLGMATFHEREHVLSCLLPASLIHLPRSPEKDGWRQAHLFGWTAWGGQPVGLFAFFHVVFAVPHLVLQICTCVMIRTVAAQEEARATILTTQTQLTLEGSPKALVILSFLWCHVSSFIPPSRLLWSASTSSYQHWLHPRAVGSMPRWS